MMMQFRSSFALVITTAAVAACSAKPNAKASTPDSTSSANGEVSGPSRTSDSAKPKGGKPTYLAEDSVRPHLSAGRNAHDSTSYFAAIRAGKSHLANWPSGPSRLDGSLLPESRIVAYYGNPHSKKMGVLGEYPEQQMLAMLDKTVAQWRAADASTPVIPAIHLVTVVAQGAAGPDGMWRRRENAQTIERAYGWATSRKGLLFIDIQAGHSTVQQELPLLLKYLQRPDVHLGIDPEFYMHYEREGLRPSSKIGTMHA